MHATLLLQAGVPINVVSQRLGDSDAAITLRVYAHVLKVQMDEAASTFAAVMGGRQTTSVSTGVSTDVEVNGSRS